DPPARDAARCGRSTHHGDPRAPRTDRTRRNDLLVRAFVGRAVEELSGGRVTRSALDRLHAATEGNPLFVVEYLRLADEQGATPGSAVLPEGIADALAGRLAMLDDAAHEALATGDPAPGEPLRP